jgi:hypothetical protein
MKIATFLDSECRMATLRNLDRLRSLKLKTEKYFHQSDSGATFLCSKANSSISAHAFGSFAVILFRESFLTQAPELVIQTVAIHEMVHLRFGSELRNALEVMHPDVALLMHKSIIESWLDKEVEIISDGEYISNKGWRDLYEGWFGPTYVEFQKALITVNNYFVLLKQDLIFVKDGAVSSLPLAVAARYGKTAVSLKDQYTNNRQETVEKIVTGYELLQYLADCLKAAIACKIKADLITVEEAFANYISVGLTGINLEDMQKWAPQDEVKIRLAQKIQASSSVDRILEQTQTYSDLIAFCRETDILRSI